jgi:hypothetical protein
MLDQNGNADPQIGSEAAASVGRMQLVNLAGGDLRHCKGDEDEDTLSRSFRGRGGCIMAFSLTWLPEPR